jgi:hypothetical protein
MPREAMQVGIVVERRRLSSPWADHAWLPVAALAGAPVAEPWTILEESPAVTRFYAGLSELEFFSSDTATYRENLASGSPCLWIVLREADAAPGVAVRSVTADPAEGEALTESGSEVVEPVPMPPEIQERLAAFVALHHVERGFFKRKRDRADPEAMANRARTGAREDDA